MSTEDNKALVRRFYHAFEDGDEAAMKAVLSPDLVAYTHGNPDSQTRAMMLQGIRLWNAAFSDTHFTIAEQIAEGDRVASRVLMRTSHTRGEFQGVAPTGQQIEIPAVSIERIQGGQIVERQVISDWLGLMQALGRVQASQSGR